MELGTDDRTPGGFQIVPPEERDCFKPGKALNPGKLQNRFVMRSISDLLQIRFRFISDKIVCVPIRLCVVFFAVWCYSKFIFLTVFCRL